MRILIKSILIIAFFSAVLSAVFSFAKVDSTNLRDPIRETFSNRVNKFLALAQEIAPDESYFFPTYPQRLMYLAAEISQSGEELVDLNEGLVNETKNCDCKFALSQCLKKGTGLSSTCQAGGLNVFGDPCANREQINKKRSEIMNKNDQLTHLRNLLQKEMGTGLERELKTLRPEVAQELKNNLEKILGESKNIISPAETNLGLLKVSSVGNCSAACELGPICGVNACVAVGTGGQKAITLKFKVGVGLNDLKLGKIGIKNINLTLPEEIQMPKIEDAAITIPAQEIVIAFPQKTLAELQAEKILDLSSQSIGLSPQISLRQPEPINLSCPKLSFLKIPELPSLPELPKKIGIPSLKIPEIKFCLKLPFLPQIPSLPGIGKIEEMVGQLEGEIKKIEEQIKSVTNILEKNKLNEEMKKLKEESEKIKQSAKIPEIKTPELKFSTPGISTTTELKLPEIKTPEIELPQLKLSSSYQCLFSSSDGEKTQSAEVIEPYWYFQTFSFLSEKCQGLPNMTGIIGLTEKAKNCFNPENVHLTIIKECDAFWASYDPENPPAEIPSICQSLGSSCLGKQRAKERECQNLLGQNPGCLLEVLCQTNKPIYCSATGQCGGPEQFYDGYITKENVETIIKTLKEGCDKLKDEGKKEAPDSCKILPLFTGKIETPYSEEYTTSKNSCPAQKIGDFPAGFGGIQLSCALAFPTLPKISFPKIIIPDIIMPEFSIPPFIKIKLPSFIFEDLVLPDFNLCNLDDCQSIFPDLNFQLPSLNLPQLSPSLKIPPLDILFKGISLKIPLPDIKLSIQLPSIPFSLPQLNLGNLLLPELEIPEISLPTPKITFGFSGIDLSAIFDYIITFMLNALGVPDFSLCISFKIPSIFLSIVFPDYYISWLDFPTIPEIPFCKDTQAFCKDLKSSLKDAFAKAKEIEKTFNQFTQNKIQAKLDELTQIINNELTKQTNLIMEEYAQIIRAAVKERMAEVEGNIGAYIDPVDKKLKIPPIVKTLPGRKINLPLSKAGDLLGTITIPWPDDLKKIKLSKDLTYDLPTIPLSKLNYQKEIPIKGPGFQSRTLTVNLGNLGGSGDCLSKSPTGGNPLPVSQFQSNLGNIISIQAEVKNTSNKIIDILE